ncbi:MAG: hypothetical protein GY845_17215 [Planctomycetes bacterium]|nr:hypothetical protein [Planctomycetota bacterium]
MFERSLSVQTSEVLAVIVATGGASYPGTGSTGDGYRLAESVGHTVISGGVSTREIDPRTMSSRLVQGLYFAGEVLDVDADTGVYNLQAAFSTGWLAGQFAAHTA